ncbi:MAG: hypothetical protein VXA14_01940 [Euryarchaeota archaeon]|jgi:hypothetical protein|nr:hypothetical protein [Euryarchaeota archaeon]|tara:strand:+ start:239 stop:907 length:669 start_codon:yes stop_codon:yes gene_type:complete
MVMGEEPNDRGEILPQQGIAAAAKEELPSNDALELMESILQRLKPKDRHEIRDMITNRGWLSGVLLMMSGLFWWIAVQKGSDALNNGDIPDSLLGDFDFSMLAKMVPIVVFFATVVWSVGRERGHASMSNLGGLLVVPAVYYILEPLGFALLTNDVDTQTALFASLRLFALATMIHYSAKLFIDAWLLQWVRLQMMNMPVDLIPEFNQSTDMGQADEVGPSA